MKFLIIFLMVFVNYSCNKNVKNELELNCFEGIVTRIQGHNNYFGFNNDINVFFILKNDLKFYNKKLTIDAPFIGSVYCPFKVGDSVLVRMNKNILVEGKKNYGELYLWKRLTIHSNYQWESPYTHEEICNNLFSKNTNLKPHKSKGIID